MKNLFMAFLAVFAITASSAVLACPKGEHPHGGTGSHHKGGYCSYDE
jgi:hypothetical protein